MFKSLKKVMLLALLVLFTGAVYADISPSDVTGSAPYPVPPGTLDVGFIVNISSPDWEYCDQFVIDLPDAWTVNTVYPCANTGCSGGTTQFVGLSNIVTWQTTEAMPTGCGPWYGTTTFVVNVTIPNCTGAPWNLPWTITGDYYGAPPNTDSGTFVLNCSSAPTATPTATPTPAQCPPDTLVGQVVTDPAGAWTFGVSDLRDGTTYLPLYRYEQVPGLVADITDVHWWGLQLAYSAGWSDCAGSESPATFDIVFYADNAGQPGSVLCTYTVSVTGVATGLSYSGFPCYYYSVPALATPCSMPAGGWVSIVGTSAPTSCWFLWGSSDDGNGTSLLYDASTSAWTTEAFDLSICLTGVATLGACCDPATGNCTPDTDEATCLAMYGGTGVWYGGVSCSPNPCPPPPPVNDLCEDAIAIPTPYPQTVFGTTVGATADCPAVLNWNSVWYTFYAPYASNTVTIDYCDSLVALENVGLVIYPEPSGVDCPEDCAAYILATGYEFATCPSTLVNPIVYWVNLPGPALYYLPVLAEYPIGVETDFGFTITVEQLLPCADCPTGGVAEGEPTCYPDYEDTYNGGCNSTPNVFQNIDCGDIICGETGLYLYGTDTYRDTDWYRVVIADDTVLTWTVDAEFPSLIFIMEALTEDCVTYNVLASNDTLYCDTNEASAIVGPGVYWLWVGPSVFSGVECGDRYVATLTCTEPPTFCDTPGVMYSSAPALAIPDAACPTLTTDTITVPSGAPVVGKVTVRVNITHTWDSDLEFQLTHGATTVSLCYHNGGSGANFVNTVFDDDGFAPIASGAAPFTGFYIPEEPLSAFTGMAADGAWTLELCDWAGGDTGTLVSWDLCLTENVVPDTPTPYTGPVPATGPLGVGLLVFVISGLLGLTTLRKK